ncbi:MotA/TolQ/ExbB proton channel family protein [Sphingosinicella sp. LHD-64]|uniref:motility protein A n=1 Tax=Sphingosinicella sp. LHD-64 TaxID=3072139 RepID=UPI00280D2047|nr:MotA/TolQ/ExbB proton channel family protein [Sphingosinicella sp. LHD-64]MDQ8757182.1 MotA/TolQ/ExbB proton channel family protein [Sphingosinicella sp. LHD-64]
MVVYLDRVIDPLSLLIVLGGTLVTVIVSATRADRRRALGALRTLFIAKPDTDARTAEQAVRRIESVSEYRGIVFADRVNTPVEFVHRLACRLADADGSSSFSLWARAELEERRTRHEGAISVWRHAAEVAPSMGMIGTVLGLIGMFAQMNDPSAMGPAMATAMLTTLYGLFLSAVIAGPVAARLERLSQAECQWQTRVVDRLIELARSEEEAYSLWRARKTARQVG